MDIDSPAYYAGLQAGDVISAINGQSVLTIQQFSEKLFNLPLLQKLHTLDRCGICDLDRHIRKPLMELL